MTFENIAHSIPSWINSDGSDSGIVISSRARLARNISGITYTHRAGENKLGEVISSVLESAEKAGFDPKDFFPNSTLSETQKMIFIERHLMTPLLASRKGNHGVLVKETESSSVLINEEDHLRLQSLRPGFDIVGALNNVEDIDDKLSETMTFSFSKEYGYLTACPTNMGTGLRASVLIHLPALILTKEIQRVIRSAGQIGLAIRGHHGEGTDVIGNLFQISNQRSLGKSEGEIVDDLISVVNHIIDYEKKAAEMLMKDARVQIEDKIWRSIGILKSARVLSTHEFMNLNSAVRLGIFYGLIDKPKLSILNELLIITQPAHLQEHVGRQLEPMERDVVRASIVRERFIDVKE